MRAVCAVRGGGGKYRCGGVGVKEKFCFPLVVLSQRSARRLYVPDNIKLGTKLHPSRRAKGEHISRCNFNRSYLLLMNYLLLPVAEEEK